MRKELDDQIVANYPELFKDRKSPMRNTIIPWGFSCGDGWYDIIDTLCNMLTFDYRFAKNNYESLKRSNATQEKIDIAKEKMDNELANVPTVAQVKEKFGGLTFRINDGKEKHYNYINFANLISYKTCEVCGVPGKLYTGGWQRTLCHVHAVLDNREEAVNE